MGTGPTLPTVSGAAAGRPEVFAAAPAAPAPSPRSPPAPARRPRGSAAHRQTAPATSQRQAPTPPRRPPEVGRSATWPGGRRGGQIAMAWSPAHHAPQLPGGRDPAGDHQPGGVGTIARHRGPGGDRRPRLRRGLAGTPAPRDLPADPCRPGGCHPGPPSVKGAAVVASLRSSRPCGRALRAPLTPAGPARPSASASPGGLSPSGNAWPARH
jgi:hypothetical protein